MQSNHKVIKLTVSLFNFYFSWKISSRILQNYTIFIFIVNYDGSQCNTFPFKYCKPFKFVLTGDEAKISPADIMSTCDFRPSARFKLPFVFGPPKFVTALPSAFLSLLFSRHKPSFFVTCWYLEQCYLSRPYIKKQVDAFKVKFVVCLIRNFKFHFFFFF